MAGGLYSPSAGDVLTAANAIDMWSKQVRIQCTSGTRPASPRETMAIDETDTDLSYRYDGAAWRLLGVQQCNYQSLTPAATTMTITLPSITNGGALRVKGMVQNSGATGINFLLRFNGDSGANYHYNYTFTSNSANAAGVLTGQTSMLLGQHGNDNASRWSHFSIDVPNFQGAQHKEFTSMSVYPAAYSAATMCLFMCGGSWASTSAITSVTLVAASNNLAAGSIMLAEVTGTM